MNQIRKRLTYANVMSSIAVFLVIGGGAAFAALGKNSVGPKQLKKNAVRTAKVRGGAITAPKLHKNAVRTAKVKNGAIATNKLKNGAVTGGKVADGSLTGADIDAASTPFGRVVHSASGNSPVALGGGFTIYPLNNNTYTQGADENNSFFAALDVTFDASCTQPRNAQALLLVDPVNPAVPTLNDVAGQGQLSDTGVGTVSKRINLGPFVGGGGAGNLFKPGTAKQHTLYLVAQATCKAGTSVNATFGGVDVVGVK